MVELLLDPAIRVWVILPIVLISLMFGLVRHYVTILLQSESKSDATNIQDGQALIRSRFLRENGGYIPEESFKMRRHYFNNASTGYFKQERANAPTALTAMGDPSMAMDMMKSTFTNVLPMIAIGGWINWTFSGFLATKVPFPLTYRFKAMLQRGVNLHTLSASWVSSMSWYFLNVFGLRSIYSLLLGSDNAADQSRHIAMQMSMQQNPAMGGKQQAPSQMFKGEWEALEVVKHKDCLQKIEERLLHGSSPLPLTDRKRKKEL